MLSPDRIPRSLVISHGTSLGGNGRSWSVPTYILLGGHFPDVLPGDEDPVPQDGNPHPLHGHVPVNQNIIQHWQHDLAGASQEVQADAGINGQQAQQMHDDLAVPQDDQGQVANENVVQEMEVDQVVDIWDNWDQVEQNDLPQNIEIDDNAPPAHLEHPQDTISFDQFGSTANFLRQHGQDIVLTLEQVLDGQLGNNSSSSESSSSVSSAVQGSSDLLIITSPSLLHHLPTLGLHGFLPST